MVRLSFLPRKIPPFVFIQYSHTYPGPFVKITTLKCHVFCSMAKFCQLQVVAYDALAGLSNRYFCHFIRKKKQMYYGSVARTCNECQFTCFQTTTILYGL